jgi:D-alanine-D-alanine ligase
MAIRAHNSLGCAVYSRTDFIVKNKQVVILEINTLPGLTKNSLLPKSAAAQGISFSELLDIIIESSLRKYQ